MKEMAVKIVKTKKEEGFTLLEILVAISILTVGLLAVASMQLSAIRGNAFAEGVTEATSLAVDRMEYLMAQDYDDPTDPDHPLNDKNDDKINGLNNSTDGTADYYKHYPREDYGHLHDYNVYWNTAPDEPSLNTKTIRVIVTWTEKGVQKRVFLDFIRANI